MVNPVDEPRRTCGCIEGGVNGSWVEYLSKEVNVGAYDCKSVRMYLCVRAGKGGGDHWGGNNVILRSVKRRRASDGESQDSDLISWPSTLPSTGGNAGVLNARKKFVSNRFRIVFGVTHLEK
jgi:hypothetical protein